MLLQLHIEHNRSPVSKETGAAARKAEARKVREYKSKVDGRHTDLIPVAIELMAAGAKELFFSLRTWSPSQRANFAKHDAGGYFTTLWNVYQSLRDQH